MKKTVVIGITGQTGAGKSTVCSILKKAGAGIIDADRISREVMSAGSPCLLAAAEYFGQDILADDGSLIRSRLAEKAFSSRENTDMLNRIVHPFIISKTKEYIDKMSNKYDMIIFDAPQLFESGGDSLCDSIITVAAPENIRLQRIIQRDIIDEAAARLRIAAQQPPEFYTERSDLVIDGSDELGNIEKIVLLYLGKC